MEWSDIIVAAIGGFCGVLVGVLGYMIKLNVNSVKMDGDTKLIKAEMYIDFKDEMDMVRKGLADTMSFVEKSFKEFKDTLLDHTSKLEEYNIFKEEIDVDKLFYTTLIKIGVDAIADITKYNKGVEDKRAVVYLTASIDWLKEFSKDFLAFGIENLTPEIVNTRASSIVQNMNKLYVNLFGKENAKRYIIGGQDDRNLFLNKIIFLIDDLANSKPNRYRSDAETYAYTFTAAFTTDYFANQLFNSRECEEKL